MIRFLLCLLLLIPLHAAANGCQGEIACPLGDRSYHVLAPEGWDGQTPLPVLLHFHGWARQGDIVVGHPRIAGATKTRGVLLVAPNGHRKTWDFWTSETEDVGFANDVLADVAKHYPIDPDRIYVSGYSYGSAMAWRYVCESGDGVAALLAVAGSIRQTEDCTQAPHEVRHAHGLKDRVMDFPMGPDGDTTYPVALWRAKLGCHEASPQGDWSVVPFLTLSRTTWADCDAGTVTLDLHPGGHFIPHGWIGWQLDELAGRVPTYP
ncbi:polyhydroxybutyrate depolymerase [Ruegeria sp. 2012CJ41-6]|uniref:Polyhydroxybutyrate depolymerase n=1 Tax=Ruegeria spongiae TaxID=2942209 RepID=A0ABT0Q3W4_9RHOB|nr:polyhydroxybutyrate depolymerase [Ruegeria spongiae]MCL6284505.1 polyhydroxybutyrate depolymerase [Ruegeria spongiae]